MKPIVFYDGNCGLCDVFVRILLKIDKKKKLQFAPLQGKTSEKTLPSKIRKNLDTVVVKDDKNIFIKSNASIHSLWTVGGIWKIAIIGKIIPRIIRDKIYDFIAKNRHKWFKKKCEINKEKERFLP